LPLIPSKAPEKGEKWDYIMNDFTDLIMPGVSLLYLFINSSLFLKLTILDYTLATPSVSCLFSFRK